MPRTERITTAKNPLLKEVRRALSRGELTASGLCVAETFHLLEEALKSGLEIPAVLASERAYDQVLRLVGRRKDVRLACVADEVFAEISATESAQGVMALVKPPAWTLDRLFEGRTLVLVLDGVQDPGNAGAILRAAEAFGATGALLLKGTVSVWNAKTLRASAGSAFRLPFGEGVSIDAARGELARRGLNVYAAAPHGGQAAYEADLAKPCALIVGSEGRGVSKEMLAGARELRIPTANVESLNAAVATGILLYEAWRQRTAT
jgi:RNA methyltransferase, TrmH family